MTSPADTIREALERFPLALREQALAALTELEARTQKAISLLNGIDYDEGSRIDRAVRTLEGEDV